MGIYPFEDYQNYSPYIHTVNDLIGVSVNSFEMSQQYCRMNIACLAEIANPMGGSVVQCNPVTNFYIHNLDSKEVVELVMSWDSPEEGSTGELEHFDVYRDNVVIASVDKDDYNEGYLYVDTITVNTQAEYFIMAVYSDGCEAPSQTETGYGYVSIEESNALVSVFPNPTENQLNIIAEGIQSINFYNAIGQLVKTVKAEGQNQHTISVEAYPSGIYTLQIVTDEGVFNKNVVVK
jgi:hypothetical protein